MKTVNFSSYNNMHPFYCLHCGRNFKDYPYLYAHVIREMINLEYSALNELQKGDPKGTQPDKVTLQIAKKNAHKSKPYELIKQTLEENRKRRPFICYICHKNFREKQTLKGHYLRVHHINMGNAIKTGLKG